jgi:ubiquinone/menaquinone biosynthesis C-methylase UbiE
MARRQQQKNVKQDTSFTEKVKEIVWKDPAISAKFRPRQRDETAWIRPRVSFSCFDVQSEDRLPVPPSELWGGYWTDAAQYLASGKKHFTTMMDKLEYSGFLLKERECILDFGCGSGRIIRCFKDHADGREIWGVDISDRHIQWCKEHLCPPFKFLTTTTFPHLPFEDNYFDIIYAGSVFTHIVDLAEAWVLELKRILNPQGRMYITVYDNHSIEILSSCPPDSWLHGTTLHEQLAACEREKQFTETGFSMIVLSRDPGDSVVFYDIDFLKMNWGNFFKVLSVDEKAFDYQTALTLCKTTFE